MNGAQRGTSPAVWIGRLLLIVVIASAIYALWLWAGRLVLIIPTVIIGYAVVGVLLATWRGAAAARAFRAAHPDRHVLLVYSDNPHWTAYVEREWVQRRGASAVLLDISNPGGRADPAALAIFRSVAGTSERTPVAIAVPPAGSITVMRFWRAARDLEAGGGEALRAFEAQLDRALERSARVDADREG